MSKFNWNRFYDELEEGDPKKFPFWLFFINEMMNMVGIFLTSFITAIILSIFIITALPTAAKIVSKNEILISSFCKTYTENSQ